MQSRCVRILAAALLSSLVWSGAAAGDDPAQTPVRDAQVGFRVDDFELRDVRGNIVRLSDYDDHAAVVVAFIGTECPLANRYAPRLAQLAGRYGPRGVAVLAINANAQDTPIEVAVHAREHGLEMPVMKDYDAAVADLFGARRTPEVFVLADREVRYRGRIDDQYGVGYQRPQPSRHDLAEALDDLLAGRDVAVPVTPVEGCLIARPARRPPAGSVTYTNQVSRILNARCAHCHRPGQAAPLALLTYDQAAGWAPMIREVVLDRRMPPWHADPSVGRFANDCSLTEEEIATLVAWVDDGAPRGDLADLPPAGEAARPVDLGEPDLVLTMPQPFAVPAAGVVEYQYIEVPAEFDHDVWVRAIEIRPGNPAVVHHILVFLFPPEGRPDDFDGGLVNGFFAGIAPGGAPAVFTESLGKRIPAGSRVVFQMHYTPNGTAQSDQSSLALYFADEAPRAEIRTRGVFNLLFTIPPHEHNHRVRAAVRFDDDAYLFSFNPHMHLRGSAFEYEARFPDGSRELLLRVPRYDFNWQHTYELAEPRCIPAGTQIVCTAYYDNSADNPHNPDPSASVGWGDQTWDEMMIGWVNYVLADEYDNVRGAQPP